MLLRLELELASLFVFDEEMDQLLPAVQLRNVDQRLSDPRHQQIITAERHCLSTS